MSRGTAPKVGASSQYQIRLPLPAPGLIVAEVMADVPHCQGKSHQLLTAWGLRRNTDSLWPLCAPPHLRSPWDSREMPPVRV